ncbi:LacI family DNA-binding transcriptional regulator [Actinoplanes sp. NPDC051411]|uniref:LacI family DNA-binding transcriptional regulator n=1 Tax=Actinoplanes sp. NPDC051411 TaxID=3155522 RepID=UPI00343F2ACD
MPNHGIGRDRNERPLPILSVAVAGVSVPTVSRVLNGDDQVAAATRVRIERLLEEYDYRARNARPAGKKDLLRRAHAGPDWCAAAPGSTAIGRPSKRWE